MTEEDILMQMWQQMGMMQSTLEWMKDELGKVSSDVSMLKDEELKRKIQRDNLRGLLKLSRLIPAIIAAGSGILIGRGWLW